MRVLAIALVATTLMIGQVNAKVKPLTEESCTELSELATLYASLSLTSTAVMEDNGIKMMSDEAAESGESAKFRDIYTRSETDMEKYIRRAAHFATAYDVLCKSR